MFKKILVCLDGSSLAEQILPLAKKQALCFNSRVVLLQVIPSPTTVQPTSAFEAGLMSPPTQSEIALVLEQHKEMERGAADYLEKKAGPLREKGIAVECVVAEGRPEQVILDFANKKNIELIALATHGRSGFGKAIFGSVADHVLKNSGLPVLLIKPKQR